MEIIIGSDIVTRSLLTGNTPILFSFINISSIQCPLLSLSFGSNRYQIYLKKRASGRTLAPERGCDSSHFPYARSAHPPGGFVV